MIEDMKQKVRDIFKESLVMPVDQWWDSIGKESRQDVLRSLALSSKDNVAFKDLSPSTKSEIQAYNEKHKGRIK